MPTLRRISTAGAAAALATFGWLVTTAPALSAGSLASPTAFTEPGTHEFTVPAGVSCATFDVYGAEGRSGGNFLAYGGGVGANGGRVTATLAVSAGEVLTLVVGGAGQPGQGVDPVAAAPSDGGFNGGGDGGLGDAASGGGGGGASDVRRGGAGLEHRILVGGGGGGGAGGGTGGQGGAGGAGGQPGEDGDDAALAPGEVEGQVPVVIVGLGGGGGTTAGPGAAGGQSPVSAGTAATSGDLGSGGDGGDAGSGGGGAGGGYYGGGGGGAGVSAPGGGGGGGASYGPANATFVSDVGTPSENGQILVSWTVGDTSCVPVEAGPDAIEVDPKFTG